MKFEYRYIVLMSSAILMAACTGLSVDRTDQPGGAAEGVVSFSAGSENVTTKASTVYMPAGVRFSAQMYAQVAPDVFNYHGAEHAYLEVEGALGNSLYRQVSFVEPENEHQDSYHNDVRGSIFYWKSRNLHAFVGYIDDYNKALAHAQDSSVPYVPTPLTTAPIYVTIPDALDPGNPDRNLYVRYYNINLKNPGTWTSMSDMPDPLIASAEKQPLGSSNESNRVYLTFRHQFSQIQVCLKSHESMGVGFDMNQVNSVELLGVSESARIYPFVAYRGNNVCERFDGQLIRTAEGTKPAGDTSSEMFKEGTPTFGYEQSYQSIAFGKLNAIRIKWTEQEAGHIQHVVTYELTDTDFINLKSGKRYVFNFELRRGTLAVIQTVIEDWIPYETIYSTDGTIQK